MTANPSFDAALTRSLMPSPRERTARARGDLALGLPCLLSHGSDRAVIAAVETLSVQRFAALCHRLGAPELLLSAERARAVLPTSAEIDDAVVRLQPPTSADLDWFKGLADPRLDAARRPSGPLHVIRQGSGALQGAALRLVKAAELMPSAMVFHVQAHDPLDDLPLASLEADETLEILHAAPAIAPVCDAALPIVASDTTRLHVFRDAAGNKEHYAIEIGTLDRSQPVLSRVHSACFTGDVLGSLKCDCGPQLRAALERMGQNGSGMLLYLNQEGRGIGLANKMRVYDLQSQGFDTVEANHRLGFRDDERDFRVAAMMLRTLNIPLIRLLTNNPAKVDAFATSDIDVVEQLPLRVGRNPHNQQYLAVKAAKSGHSL